MTGTTRRTVCSACWSTAGPPTKWTSADAPTRAVRYFVLMNAGTRARSFKLPQLPERGVWREVINTAAQEPAQRVPKAKTINLHPHSLLLLCYEVS